MGIKAGGKRPLHPAMEKAIADEKAIILDVLADPKFGAGAALKDFEKAIKAKQGYKTTTVRERVAELVAEKCAHQAGHKGKGGCYLYLLGPEPQVELPFEQEPDAEPPLAGDELLSFCFEMEKKLCLKIARLEELAQSQQKCMRMMSDHIVRTNVQVTALCEQLGVDLTK